VAGDAALLAEAFERAQTVLRVTVEEGIQPDYSFHQHGAQLYSGGYGHEFACDAVRLATLASGTKFAFGPEAIEVLTRYVLDGLRWMIHAGQYDVTCLGRENSRPGAAHKARLLAPFVRDLARVTSERGDELMALADRLDGCDGAIPVAGARYFWRSDYLAVHRAGWSASVKLSSTRTVLPESGNDEGLRNRHLADGVCLLQRGAVASIAPVWNWRMLPGLTAVHHTGGFPTSTFGLDDSGEWVTGGSQFAGGVSDGESAIAAMHLRHDGVSAQKAWFFFPGGYAALGTGIVSLVDHPVRTTVEQTRFAGEYAVPAGTARAGRSTHERLAWLEHDNVRYVFPETSTVQVEAGPVTGSWSAISGCQSGTPIHDNRIVVWLDHGVRPDSASYCYFVLPERGGATPVILANDLALQAIWHQDTVHAVFHEPGVLDLPDGRSIEVDKPLLVLLAQGRVHAANPLGADDVVTIGLGADRIRLTVSRETTSWPGVAR
jgi:chondroitin AC lyase